MTYRIIPLPGISYTLTGTKRYWLKTCNAFVGVLICLLLLIPAIAFAQLTITGRIINQNDKKPLAYASVFLSNATVGDKTINDGTFKLQHVKPGKYQLVVSIIGFEKYSQVIIAGNANLTLPDIEIAPKAIALQEVSIKPDLNRQRNYELFLKEFLGTTYLANDCRIVNPDILNLSYDDERKILAASSDDFLEIENTALGYRIKYLLNSFTTDYKVHKMQFEGAVLFEKLKGTQSQLARWERNRLEVYQGSQMHFLRSVLTNRIDEEGFRVLQLSVINNPERPGDSIINAKIAGFEKNMSAKSSKIVADSIAFWRKKLKLPKTIETLMHFPLSALEFTKPTNQRGLFALGCDNDKMHVTYNKNHRFPSAGVLYRLDDLSNTTVTLVSFNAVYAFFDSNGWINNPNSIAITGAWSQSRVAGLLPSDYETPGIESKTAEPAITPPTPAKLEPQNQSLKKIITQSDSTIKKYPAEKLYLQLNKPNYAVGDTIWYKAYLFNAPTLALSAKSGIMYVELNNDSNTYTKQFRLPVKNGVTWGDISLAEVPPGNYTLHAYTTWMRNFGADCFFTRQFTIVAERQGNANPVKSRSPAAINRIAIRTEARELKKAQDIDLQFLPEGGSLISDMPAHIAFKAVGEDGKGVNVAGVIINGENQTVATLPSQHQGMGSFDLVLKEGEHYKARINLPGNLVREYPLPGTKSTGTSLNVINLVNKDSVKVTIAATKDIAKAGESYFLIGKARNVTCYAAVFNFNDGNTVTRNIAKSLFPTGITHFMLMTTKNHPLNERLVFINHHDNLNVTLTTSKFFYKLRDSIATQIKVTDAAGQPVAGRFSMSITDDNQVSIDSLQDNILTHVLLTADLKGNIEQPNNYFRNSEESALALDNLMLTQGWVSYDLPADKPQPVYAAEDVFAIKGKVINGLQSPFKGVKVTMLSKSPLIVRDTLSDNNGRFIFANFPRIDSPAFILNAVNKHNKSFNVGIIMDDEKTVAFASTLKKQNNDADTVIDSTLLISAKNNRIRKQQSYLAPDGHMLKEVKVKAQKIVKGSQNLNGPGQADVVLDEADLEKEGKKSWLDILQGKIIGLRESRVRNQTAIFALQDKTLADVNFEITLLPATIGDPFYWYYTEDKPITFIIDGVPLSRIFKAPNLRTPDIEDIRDYLKSHNAEDIKGIELNTSTKYSGIYFDRYLQPDWHPYLASYDFAYVEITTRAGRGPFFDNTPGTYLYKPLALSWPKEFYKPKYNMAAAKRHPDTRSAVDWEPNIVTDDNGKATVSFYTADKPGTYTMILEGCDDNGNLGYQVKKIIVK